MREADRTVSRRTFLRRMLVGTAVASTALVVGEEAWEALEALAPRPVIVPGMLTATYPIWDPNPPAARLTLAMIERAAAQIYGVPVAVWRKHMDDHRRAAVANGANPLGGYLQHERANARFLLSHRSDLCPA